MVEVSDKANADKAVSIAKEISAIKATKGPGPGGSVS